MRWQVKVSNVNTRLRVRTGPSTSYRIVNWQYPSGGGIVVESRTTNGATWYRWEGTNYWSCAKTRSGTVYLTKVKDLEEKPKPAPAPKPQPVPEKVDVTLPPIKPDPVKQSSINVSLSDSTIVTPGEVGWYQPMNFKEGDYSVKSDLEIARKIAALKHNMDIGYSNKNDIYDGFMTDNNKGYYSNLQKKMYNSFNRNKVAFPDKELNKTFAYVFFTRPDLNILTSAGSGNFKLNFQTEHDGKFLHIWKNNPWCMKSLVRLGNPYHHFMTFLSNEALSFEVGDVVLKTKEHGETYNGNKIIYGFSDVESNTAGEMSIRYIDTVNLDVFKLHLIWTDYINKVSRGIFVPKSGYIKNKILDYASSCYYFLCGNDGSTILYWQKLTGVFPVNTSENTFSWDSGTLLAKPEINIKYMYSFKSSMDEMIIHEFNNLTKEGNFKKTYEEENIMTGSTLTHSPYIYRAKNHAGNYEFKLCWVESR